MAGAGASSLIDHAMSDDAQSRFDTNHVMESRSAKDPYSRTEEDHSRDYFGP